MCSDCTASESGTGSPLCIWPPPSAGAWPCCSRSPSASEPPQVCLPRSENGTGPVCTKEGGVCSLRLYERDLCCTGECEGTVRYHRRI